MALLKHALPVALTHPAPVIRRGALDLVSVLLLQCTESIGVCVPPLLHTLAALCADSAEEIAEARISERSFIWWFYTVPRTGALNFESLCQAALALVDAWARRGRMGEAVSTSLQAVLAQLLSLPVTFRCKADEAVKRLALQARILKRPLLVAIYICLYTCVLY